MRLVPEAVVLHLLVLFSRPAIHVNANEPVDTDGTTVVTEVAKEATNSWTGSDATTDSVTNGTEAATFHPADGMNQTTSEEANSTATAAASTTAEPTIPTTTSTTTRRTTRTTTTTTTTTTTPAPPDWRLLPVERCLCRLDRSLSWARQRLIAQILLAEVEPTGPALSTTAAPAALSNGTDADGNTTDTYTTSNDNDTAVWDLGEDAVNVTAVTVTDSTADIGETAGLRTDGPGDASTEQSRRRKREAEASTETPNTTATGTEASDRNSTEPCTDGTCGNITDTAQPNVTYYGNSTEGNAVTDAVTAEMTTDAVTATAATSPGGPTTAAPVPSRADLAGRFPPGVMASGRPRRLSLCHCPDRVEEVWGTIRIFNLHWRTVLLYPDNVAHQRATKYIHEQLDRIFRNSLGSLYATSEVLNMEEGSVIAHHKVYLTREVDNITDLVRSSFEVGYKAGVSGIQIDNSSISYYIPPEPPGKPAVWYLRYLALVLALGILIAILYDVCMLTNACAIRSQFGYLEDPNGKPNLTMREQLTIVARQTKAMSEVVANRTKSIAGRGIAASRTMAIKTKDMAIKTGKTMSDRDTFRRVGSVVATNAVFMKTIGTLKRSKSVDQRPTVDPEQGPSLQAEELEKQLQVHPEPEEEAPDRPGDAPPLGSDDNVAPEEVEEEAPESVDKERDAEGEDTEDGPPAEEAAEEEPPAEEAVEGQALAEEAAEE